MQDIINLIYARSKNNTHNSTYNNTIRISWPPSAGVLFSALHHTHNTHTHTRFNLAVDEMESFGQPESGGKADV